MKENIENFWNSHFQILLIEVAVKYSEENFFPPTVKNGFTKVSDLLFCSGSNPTTYVYLPRR